VRDRVFALIAAHPQARRWIYIPYAVIVAAWILMGLVMGEPAGSLAANSALLLVLVVQIMRPTILGWAVVFVLWFCFAFVGLLYARIFMGIVEFNNWVLLCVGILPLLPLFVFRPSRRPPKLHSR
jgi:hypothetical protein